MENAKKIYIIISIICVLSIVLGAYAQFFGKRDSKTSDIPTNNTTDENVIENPVQPEKEKTMEELKNEFVKTINNSFNVEEKDISKIERINTEKSIVYIAYSIQQENKFYDIDLNIPMINIKGNIPKEFNKVTQEVFVKKANEVRKNKNNAEKIIYSIDYVGYLNDNILSIIIKSSLKQGNNPQRIIIQTYNYNIETKEKVSLNKLWNRRTCTKFNGVSYVVQRAAEATFTEEGQKQIKENIAYYMENAKTIKNGLEDAGYTVFGGTNSPYVWLKVPDGITSWEFFDKLLEEVNVVGTPGSGFGPHGEGYFRLTAFGTKENTKEAIERIKNWKLKK